MAERISYSRCRHFDTPRCPNNDNEFIRKVAIEIPDLNKNGIQYEVFNGIEEAEAICKKCVKFEHK